MLLYIFEEEFAPEGAQFVTLASLGGAPSISTETARTALAACAAGTVAYGIVYGEEQGRQRNDGGEDDDPHLDDYYFRRRLKATTVGVVIHLSDGVALPGVCGEHVFDVRTHARVVVIIVLGVCLVVHELVNAPLHLCEGVGLSSDVHVGLFAVS